MRMCLNFMLLQTFLLHVVYSVDNFSFPIKVWHDFFFLIFYFGVHLSNGISIQLKSFVLEFLFSLYLPTEKADKQLHEAFNNTNMRYYNTANFMTFLISYLVFYECGMI